MDLTSPRKFFHYFYMRYRMAGQPKLIELDIDNTLKTKFFTPSTLSNKSFQTMDITCNTATCMARWKIHDRRII